MCNTSSNGEMAVELLHNVKLPCVKMGRKPNVHLFSMEPPLMRGHVIYIIIGGQLFYTEENEKRLIYYKKLKSLKIKMLSCLYGTFY